MSPCGSCSIWGGPSGWGVSNSGRRRHRTKWRFLCLLFPARFWWSFRMIRISTRRKRSWSMMPGRRCITIICCESCAMHMKPATSDLLWKSCAKKMAGKFWASGRFRCPNTERCFRWGVMFPQQAFPRRPGNSFFVWWMGIAEGAVFYRKRNGSWVWRGAARWIAAWWS